MLHSHPPSQEIRQTIDDFRDVAPTPDQHHAACSCCAPLRSNKNSKQVKIFVVVVFAVTLFLVALNAFEREQRDQDFTSRNQQHLGPGATQAAELSFPTKTPTQAPVMYYSMPVQQTQYAVVPYQAVRPGEPALQYMTIPVQDGKGGVKLKRFVGR